MKDAASSIKTAMTLRIGDLLGCVVSGRPGAGESSGAKRRHIVRSDKQCVQMDNLERAR